MAETDEHALLLQISYDLARLEKQSNSAQGIVDKGLTGMERRAKKAAVELEETLSLKGLNLQRIEGAMAGVFNSARIATFDRAGESIAGAGTALEGLGAAGLVGAAGVAAAGLAIEQAMKAGEWAVDLEHQANALNVTTTQLQQYRLVAAAGGVDAAKFAEGLSGINRTLGGISTGLLKGKQLQEFVKQIGISPETLKSWGTFDQQLPHVLDALAKLNPQDLAAVSARFKVDPETLASIVELREQLKAASGAGDDFGIMTEEQVRNLADMKKEIDANSAQIAGNFRRAFLNAQPAVEGMQNLLNRFATGLVRVEDLFGGFVQRFSSGAQTLRYYAELDLAYVVGLVQTLGGLTGDPLAGAKAVFANHQAALVGAALGAQIPAPAAPKPTNPPHLHINAGGHHAGEKADVGATDLAEADKALAEAQKALATSFEARAQFELQELAADEAKQDTKLADDLKKAKTAEQRATIERAQAETAQAFALKREAVTRQRDQQIADQASAMAQLGLQGQIDVVKAQDALGGTTAQHAAVALRIFDLEQQIERSKLEEVIASKTATDAERERAQQQLANLNASSPLARQKIEADSAIAASAAAANVREQALQTQIDQLNAEQAVFQTTERRRQIALQLFALDEQLQESKLREQIAEAQIAGQTEKAAILQSQLASLQQTAGLRGQAVSDANPANAWQAWANAAKQATADVSNSLAQMRVDGMEALNNSIFDSEGRFTSLGNVARSVARAMITDFEKFSLQSIEGGLFGGGSPAAGNPLQGIASSIGRALGLGGSKPGGVTQPKGTAADPIFVTQAPGLTGLTGGAGGAQGGGLTGGLGDLLGKVGGGLSSAASGAGGFLSSLLHFIPGFAGGGSFTVGGRGGVDRNLAMMRLSAGERVTIETPQQQRDRLAGGIGNVSQTFNFPGANPEGFRRSQRQWGRQARTHMQYFGAV